MTVIVTKFVQHHKLFLRAFSRDVSKNANGWRVVPTSIKQNIKSFMGFPLVLARITDTRNSRHNPSRKKRYSRKASIRRMIEVVEKDRQYDAVIKVTNAAVKDAFASHDIPNHVSTLIIHNTNERDSLSNWMGFCMAVTKEPAYGDKEQSKAHIMAWLKNAICH